MWTAGLAPVHPPVTVRRHVALQQRCTLRTRLAAVLVVKLLGLGNVLALEQARLEGSCSEVVADCSSGREGRAPRSRRGRGRGCGGLSAGVASRGAVHAAPAVQRRSCSWPGSSACQSLLMFAHWRS